MYLVPSIRFQNFRRPLRAGSSPSGFSMVVLTKQVSILRSCWRLLQWSDLWIFRYFGMVTLRSTVP